MKYKAILFDLDGVIVSTDEYHYRAWKQLADEQGIPFDKKINDRLRGVSRMESLNILLEQSSKAYDHEEKIAMATRKNALYRELIDELTHRDLLPGTMEFLNKCRENGVLVAIGSSSKNARFILGKIGLGEYFDAVVDGTDIRNSKPDPEVFVLGSQKLNLAPSACLVVEDADAGVDAGLAGGMEVLAVGAATGHPEATHRADDLEEALKLWPFA